MSAATDFSHRALEWLISHPRFAIVGAYGFAWWPHLALFGGRFWDDWVLHNTTFEYLWTWTTQLGFPWVSFVTWPLSQWPPSFAILGFSLLAISSILWFEILARTPGVTRGIALLSTILSVVAPFYLARFGWVQIQAIIGLIFFLLAWRSASKAIDFFSNKSLFLFSVFLLVSISLYGAFMTLSVGLLFHLFFVSKTSAPAISLRAFFKFSAVTSFLVIGWFTVNSTVFRPSGTYETYQQIVLTQGLLIYALMTVLFLGLAIWTVVSSGSNARWHRSLTLIFFSVLLFLLATGPYAATGAFPPFKSWGTRYEVNYFLFTSVAVAGILILGPRLVNKSSKWLAVILIGLLVFGSNLAGIRVLSHWGKAQVIMSHIAENRSAYQGRFIVFVDEAIGLNAFPGSHLMYYEWTGLVAEATGSTASFATEARDRKKASETYERYLDNPQAFPLDRVFDYTWRTHQVPSQLLVVKVSPTESAPAWENRLNCAFRPSKDCVHIEIVEFTHGLAILGSVQMQ